MIRFVGNDAEGLPLKRKQSQRACEKCRKRKKRCLHQSSIEHYNTNAASTDNQLTTDTTSSARHRFEDAGQSRTRHSTDSDPRQPLSQLLSPATAGSITSATAPAGNTTETEEEEDHYPRFVGDLNPEGIFVASTSPAGATTAPAANSPEEVVGIWIPRRLANAAKALSGPIMPLLLQYLEDECSRALPGLADYDALYRLYLAEFHPILPLLNLDSYQRQPIKAKNLLKLGVCLLMSCNPRAAVHLGESPKDFANSATRLLRSAIDNGMVQNKQVTMQLFIVLALATQLSDDSHASAEYTGRAVTYVHTGGLQLDTSSRSDNSYMTRLFCCAFTVDRLNAAVQGRPVLMHERDFGRDLNTCIKQQDSLFQLLLQVIVLLDKVIALYRPGLKSSDNTLESVNSFDLTFPAFEDLLTACGNLRAPAALVATVETLYHAVAMLSCRSQSLNEVSRNSASHTRQGLSAASIVSIAGHEYRDQLSILPFVPYSLSLALRVSYRDLRLSKSSFTRGRARRQLLHVCTLLRELGDNFSTSVQMAAMAEQTVREIDKAYSNVASQRKTSLAGGSLPAESSHYESQRLPTIQHRQQERDHDHDHTETNFSGDSVTAISGQPSLPPAPQTQSQPETYDMDPIVDFDLDIFDHFDPDFDIQAIDAALAKSIDPALPVNLVHWD